MSTIHLSANTLFQLQENNKKTPSWKEFSLKKESPGGWSESPFSEISNLRTPIFSFNKLALKNSDSESDGESAAKRLPFKRPEPIHNTPVFNFQNRKRKCSLQIRTSSDTSNKRSNDSKTSSFLRSLSESEVSIMNAVSRSCQDPDLIGDFTKPYAMPLLLGNF